jgi:hypothetical protein
MLHPVQDLRFFSWVRVASPAEISRARTSAMARSVCGLRVVKHLICTLDESLDTGIFGFVGFNTEAFV